MDKTAEQPYSGPVLYIVHAPRKWNPKFFDEKDRKLAEANKKKIFTALERAAAKGVPVLYESPPERDWLEGKINSLRRRPRVVWLRPNDVASPHSLRTILEREKIAPKRITALGAYRNICVITGMENMRRAFPKAELVMLEGANTIYRRASGAHRADYRKRAKRNEISLAKKLGRKHLA